MSLDYHVGGPLHLFMKKELGEKGMSPFETVSFSPEWLRRV